MPYKDPQARAAYQKAYREANREKLRAKQREYVAKNREADRARCAARYAAKPDGYRAQARAFAQAAQAATREKAFRHGQEWTGPELELLQRPDLTLTRIAELTGRTYAAVAAQRHLAGKDPRKTGEPWAS